MIGCSGGWKLGFAAGLPGMTAFLGSGHIRQYVNVNLYIKTPTSLEYAEGRNASQAISAIMRKKIFTTGSASVPRSVLPPAVNRLFCFHGCCLILTVRPSSRGTLRRVLIALPALNGVCHEDVCPLKTCRFSDRNTVQTRVLGAWQLNKPG